MDASFLPLRYFHWLPLRMRRLALFEASPRTELSVVAVVVVEVGMNQFDRIAGRVADDRPRTKPVADTVDQLPIRRAQLDAFAVVVEFADPGPSAWPPNLALN